MAHFAELDKDNKVLRVVVGCNTDIANNGGEQSTQAATHFETVVPLSADGVKWMQTSYNNNFRKMYAGPGFIYDETNDRFLTPKPGASWTYDTNGDLVPPISQPSEDKIYRWDEDAYQADNTAGWVLVPNQPE
tara:strand:- start:507 stop:905 length:399 start_codon:yes stop_codon:yes gene_type:complete